MRLSNVCVEGSNIYNNIHVATVSDAPVKFSEEDHSRESEIFAAVGGTASAEDIQWAFRC